MEQNELQYIVLLQQYNPVPTRKRCVLSPLLFALQHRYNEIHANNSVNLHNDHDHYEDLPSYLRGFRYTCAVMQKAEDLTRISYELAQDCIAEGVRYIEVRFAPQLHMTDLSFDEVLQAVNDGLSRQSVIDSL